MFNDYKLTYRAGGSMGLGVAGDTVKVGGVGFIKTTAR